MKGAFDGGLEIPHSNKKFYGYDADEKVGSCEYAPATSSRYGVPLSIAPEHACVAGVRCRSSQGAHPRRPRL
jgi:hypothetical protein